MDDGTGGVANNGAIPEQAVVAFMTGEASLTQTLEPLVKDDNYELRFAYNASTGGQPHLQVKIGDAVIWEQNVTAVGGTAAYRTATVTFKATADTASLSFVNTTAGATVGNAAVDLTDTAGLLPPTDITTVYVAGTTFVLNPSFELDKDSGVATAPVTGWTTGGGNIGMAETGNPFLAVDDLTIPDRRKVLWIQNGGTVSQTIKGLQPGKLYGLQFFYNGRTAGYPYEMALQVSFAGQPLANYPSIMPAAQSGFTDYYFEELRFTPTADSGLLEFKVTVTSGDATLFLDAVSIVPRLAAEIAIKNSSFEGSAMGANWPGYLQPDRVAGWLGAGGGYGVNAYSPKTFFVEPFLDNGINSDQDNAFFGQGGVSIRQTITGLPWSPTAWAWWAAPRFSRWKPPRRFHSVSRGHPMATCV